MGDKTGEQQFKPYKRWGQNFLIDGNIARKIVSCAKLSACDTVLEIGAGKGTLTKLIARQVRKVIAIEIDSRLCDFLKEELEGAGSVQVVQGDFLKLDIPRYLPRIPKLKVKVIANLPYYITTPVIVKLLDSKWWSEAILMVQKEVGERITSVSGNKNYGSLSILVQYHCDVEKQFNVSRNVFYPRPNVDSVVIKIRRLKRPRVKVKDEATFFSVVRAGFSQRRKKLSNSLSNVLKIDKNLIERDLERLGISPLSRAEDLTIQQLGAISDCVWDRKYSSRKNTRGRPLTYFS